MYWRYLFGRFMSIIGKACDGYWVSYGKDALKCIPKQLQPAFVEWVANVPGALYLYERDYTVAVRQFLAEVDNG